MKIVPLLPEETAKYQQLSRDAEKAAEEQFKYFNELHEKYAGKAASYWGWHLTDDSKYFYGEADSNSGTICTVGGTCGWGTFSTSVR